MAVTGKLHVLRHTFCSHLAVLGAPAKAVQELAGHADLTTTMRYMHLSPAARADAIELLNRQPQEAARLVERVGTSAVTLVDVKGRGDLGETVGGG